MDPAMNIAMQHRAPQACKSCRKLKRKCVFNETLGKCNRCFETSKACVYAEVNPAAPHDDSVAVVHHNASTTSMSADSGHLDASLQQGDPSYLDPFGGTLQVTPDWYGLNQPNVLSNGGHVMGPGSGDMAAYPSPSTHAGRQN
ncbi:hypothetical protein DEU56DRAFT_909777 [Suillus clintonianus]|uniref:uncharacterized protein n=1 Tax=Suillus clintonianus TaxID=1904413 RepID=UPI001B85F045|nr:uncharacterized protein DEU56DRAFT_909777 [Suillus clintonianus]KAG2146737.1 hypothetical protein DEU56DRAFT_909777 [Suillus clintonianus]